MGSFINSQINILFQIDVPLFIFLISQIPLAIYDTRSLGATEANEMCLALRVCTI